MRLPPLLSCLLAFEEEKNKHHLGDLDRLCCVHGVWGESHFLFYFIFIGVFTLFVFDHGPRIASRAMPVY